MTADLRHSTQAALDAIGALAGDGAAALLVDLTSGIVLSRSAGAPQSQGRLDGMARDGLTLLADPMVLALHEQAPGPLAIATRLGVAGTTCVIVRTDPADEVVVLRTAARPDAAALLRKADALFALLQPPEPEAA